MLTFRSGDDAIQGGVDITISLTPTQSAAIGPEASSLADWFDTALWTLAALRSEGHEPTADQLYTTLNDIEARLLPRLEGIRDAAVRRHKELGGSVGDLGLALDMPRSTAQSRREALEKRGPSNWEKWATGTTGN
ncbi:hypothetical protein MTQ13_03115 [Streptomyces sp. XM4011]|uniref:hypothetical protein n=1 Tax=Streptomyces sp. XM4011 TaxID=2929780 RepID=UPI001FF8EBCA|nr:hypothetical protein [Streptomyces sp. XM4011]MCK1813271.1 hypothetical protein [Streptomyces sp. XM4011]